MRVTQHRGHTIARKLMGIQTMTDENRVTVDADALDELEDLAITLGKGHYSGDAVYDALDAVRAVDESLTTAWESGGNQ